MAVLSLLILWAYSCIIYSDILFTCLSYLLGGTQLTHILEQAFMTFVPGLVPWL